MRTAKIPVAVLACILNLGAQVWSPLNSGTTQALHSVCFTPTDFNTGWAVGDGGTVLLTTSAGRTWTPQSGGVSDPLYSVHAPGLVAMPVAHAAGGMFGGPAARGVVLNGNLQTWTPVTAGAQQLRAVHFPTVAVGYAVGAGGTILKTMDAGATWSPQTSGVAITLFTVFFADANIGWAGGGVGEVNGVILRTVNGGANWTRDTSNAFYPPIYSIHFPTYNAVPTGYAAGAGGFIFKSTDGGLTWIRLTNVGTTNYLYSIFFVGGPNAGFAVGERGTILYTANGGTSWTAMNSGTAEDLNSVYFPLQVAGNPAGYAVGNNGTILKYGPAVPVLAPGRKSPATAAPFARRVAFPWDGAVADAQGRLHAHKKTGT